MSLMILGTKLGKTVYLNGENLVNASATFNCSVFALGVLIGQPGPAKTQPALGQV